MKYNPECKNSPSGEHFHQQKIPQGCCVFCGQRAECPIAPGSSGQHDMTLTGCRFCGSRFDNFFEEDKPSFSPSRGWFFCIGMLIGGLLNMFITAVMNK